MIQNLPIYIAIAFGATTFLTLFLFLNALKKSGIKNANKIVVGFLFWMSIQTFIGLKGVYHQDLNAIPPKILLFGILPTILMMIFLLSSNAGKSFTNQLEIKYLTLINVVRIPVEIILFGLFINKTIPIEMTFEGSNLDILAGISSVFIFYFGFVKNRLNSRIVLIWNFLSLALLINIVVLAFLSAPSPFQKLGFDQSNIAILYFPFVWLPTVIVPIVLFGHIVSIKKLLK
jgi:hypothetical protein